MPTALPEQTTLPAQTTAPQINASAENELKLTLSQDLFIAGKQVILDLNASCAPSITGDISIMDESGTVIAILRNNGSGMLKTQIPFRRTAVGEGSLTAVCGQIKSIPVAYSVQPEITDQMISALYNVSHDLGSFAVSGAFEDPYGTEALTKIKEFLNSHAQVSEVHENNGFLLYRTVDGLMGSYGMGRETEGWAGYASAEDVYTVWKDGESVADALVQSNVALTRDRCIILCPEYESDGTMKVHASMSASLMKEVFEQVDSYNDAKAREVLADGSFTDCGMLIFNAHGNWIKRDDGSKMLFFKAAQVLSEDECKSYIKAVDSQFIWKDQSWRDETCAATLDTSIDDQGIYHTTLRLSTTFLKSALDGKSFDNTVVYLFICYGLIDTHLINLLFEHGAGMIIGCHDTLVLGYSIMNLHEIYRSLTTQNESEQYGSFVDGISSVNLDTIDKVLKAYRYSDEEINSAKAAADSEISSEDAAYPALRPYRDYRSAFVSSTNENKLISYLLRDQENYRRTYQGNSRIKGYVVTADGLPADGAMVTAYRWLDHSWQEYEHKSIVNAHGEYSFSALPYGIYALEAVMNGMSGHTTLEVNTPATEPDRILLDGGVVLLGKVDLHQANPTSANDNYNSMLVTPILLKAPNGAAEKLTERLSPLKKTMDGQIGLLQKTPVGEHESDSFAEQSLIRAFSAGNVLCIKLDAITYMQGDQRPWHGGASLNIDLDTGKTALLSDLLIDSNHTPNLRAAVMKLLHSFSDSDLNASRETLCERTLRDELGSWTLTPEGIEISYSTYDLGRYAAVGSTVIPYEVLEGELKSLYLPAFQQSPDSGSPTVRAILDTDSRFSDDHYSVWGENTGRIMAFDGEAEHVTIRACSPDDPQKTESIVFYASTLSDALIHLPVHDGTLYRIDWQRASVHSSAMVEYP